MGYKVTTPPRPVPARYSPHRVKQLEIEIFGKEWWETFGTKCGCGPCNPPNGAAVVPPFKPNGEIIVPRKRFINGVMWPMPDEVPDMAHFKVIESRWGYANCFHEGTWNWIDQVTGATMAVKVIGIGPKELAPAYRYRHHNEYVRAERGIRG